jgi:hypothetical protein
MSILGVNDRTSDFRGYRCAAPFRARTTSPATGTPDSIRSSAWAISGVSPAAVNNRST